MIHSTENYIPWSSLSITSGDDYSSCESNITHTPPDTPLYRKPVSSSDLFALNSPPLSPEQYTLSQQQHDYQQHSYYQGQEQQQQQREAQQLQLLNSIPPSINIQLNDYGLCLDTNFTDIARLRNYLLSFVMDLPSPSPSGSTSTTTQSSPISSTSSTFSGQLVSRNKRYRNKPVNLFKRFYELGQLYINGVGGNTAIIPIFFQQLILRQQTVIACIHTYFDCWVRYFPVFPRQQVLAILDQPRGLDSVIVNAIACFVLKHMLAHHHYPPALETIRRDPAKIRDMEEFFFTAAKHALEQLLFDDDNDDEDYYRSNSGTENSKTTISRFDIMGMLLMSYKVDMKKKSIYMAMAVQSLQSLQIQPGDDMDDTSAGSGCGDNSGADTDSLWKAELDTRLWWMTWMNDFAVSSSGSSTNMPSASYCHHDDILKSPTISIPSSSSSSSSSPSLSSSPIGEYPHQQQQQQQQQQPGNQNQQQNRRRRVPRLWSFDCDGASEFGIMVNEHCLSIWRMQAEIIQHHYNSTTAETDGDRLLLSSGGSVVDFSLLDSFDTQLDRFLQQLPLELQSSLPYDATPLSLVRARVHLELNATRIILHKLYIPDDIDDEGAHGDDVGGIDSVMLGVMDSSSLQWRSLNICLQSALDQVKIFHHCVMEYPSVLRCGFDRDELWRAAEIISVAVDFLMGIPRRYSNIKDQQHIEQQILHNVGTKDTLLQALHQSLMFVQNTYEVQQCNNSNFRQLEDWLKDRINYHNKSASSSYQHDGPQQQQHQQRQQKQQQQSLDQYQSKQRQSFQASSSSLSSSSSSPSSSSSFVPHKQPSTKKRKSSSSSTTTTTTTSSSSSSSFDHQISFATGPCVFTSTKPGVKHNNNNNNNAIFGSSLPSSQASSKTRFRYFSPKQNRGLLFIDENPVNG